MEIHILTDDRTRKRGGGLIYFPKSDRSPKIYVHEAAFERKLSDL